MKNHRSGDPVEFRNLKIEWAVSLGMTAKEGVKAYFSYKHSKAQPKCDPVDNPPYSSRHTEISRQT